MLCGRTCGRTAVKAAVSLCGRCSRYSPAGAKRPCRYGCISVPLSSSVGRAKNAPVEGGPKPDGRYATLMNCRRVPGRRFSAICGASEWMGCGAQVNRRRHCPGCCGGRLWTVTSGFLGCGITGDHVGRLQAQGVMRRDLG